MRVLIEERMAIETLAAMLVKFELDFMSYFVEIVNVLQDLRAYYYDHKKLDLDLKNWLSRLTKVFLEEPLVLELKQLPHI